MSAGEYSRLLTRTYMSTSFSSGLGVDPSFVLPELTDMVVVPTLLLSKRPWETVRGVDRFWVAVVVSKGWEDWTGDEVLEHLVHRGLGIFGVSTAELSLRVMGDKVTGVDSPRE